MRISAVSICLLVSIILVSNVAAFTPPFVPNPVIYFTGQTFLKMNGKEMIRYSYAVENANDFPKDMFAPAPDLPPCGTNKNASRTWVDIYDQRGKRLYGFCALGKPGDLNAIFFVLEANVVPPSWVYIEMTNRQTNTKYKSNLAETTL